ncbi:PREDICTED: CLAVATA3/ESR (CLE)-related protein 45 [Tarenaya hassleriana]|uniref:CLAVATA3/ESR (CLE)-related protein 45 n=1 Tax=Tarenaya hassleriana TaxID=28532 RepID=UPI00053C5623|nr:PREDICTED: CLAVATA3/ESR (CLE)-related protein 45 [Tarenaya hassleriana]
MLGLSTRMMLFLLVCIALLADDKCKVLGLRGKELFLGQKQGGRREIQSEEVSELRINGFPVRHTREDQGMLTQNRRILEKVDRSRMNAEKKQKPKKNSYGQYQSSKRRVRRGSDPIHNKS